MEYEEFEHWNMKNLSILLLSWCLTKFFLLPLKSFKKHAPWTKQRNNDAPNCKPFIGLTPLGFLGMIQTKVRAKSISSMPVNCWAIKTGEIALHP